MMLVLGASAQPISEQEALQKAQQFLHGKTIVSTEPAGALRRAANDNPYKHLYLLMPKTTVASSLLPATAAPARFSVMRRKVVWMSIRCPTT